MESQQIAVITVSLDEWNEHKAMLKDIREKVNVLSDQEQKELLTPKEVCERLKIGFATFNRYVNDGLIEVIKISQKKGANRYVKRSHLDELLKNGVV
ncbi:helix-turn-helix domain-containing protein [Sunxiuqinia indica]|uniref:helix-turn-helix domain-containing protein n=1 Tax=Sunxiuqinia indica TaxID=2692584 RepID=UPI00135BE505|nr:helix-turn-helix domain-containing protein [Sunxiuqinia indica]